MKYLLANLGANLVALASIAAAVYLISHGDKEAWGWFVFLAVISSGSVLLGDKSSK